MHYIFVIGDIHSCLAGSMTEIVGDVEERRISQTEAYVTKALQGKCPENINPMFIPSNTENYKLRNNNFVLRLSIPNTNAMKRNFSYAAAKIWNSQDAKIRKKVLDQ